LRLFINKIICSHIAGSGSWVLAHPEQPGRLAARLFADDPDIKPCHFGHVDRETTFA
jgi:hypothetical protein